MSEQKNICAITTTRILTGLSDEQIRLLIATHGSPQLRGELERGEQLGDDVFQIVGEHNMCRFDIWIYLSDNEKVLIKSMGLDLGPCNSQLTTHNIRWEVFGMTYDDVKALPMSPLFMSGHWEPCNTYGDEARVVKIPSSWNL